VKLPRRHASLGLAAFLALATLGFMLVRRPIQVHYLPDGTKVVLTGITAGKSLRMFVGEPWQQPLQFLFKTNLPPRIVGTESIFPSARTNGSLGLVFIRSAHKSPLVTPKNGSLWVMLLRPDGTEEAASLRATHFKTRKVGAGRKVFAEQLLWELPPSDQLELRVRMYHVDATARAAIIREFKIRNPLVRP
jgi:hypothetical protein